MTRKLAFVGFSYLAGLFIGSFFVLRLSLAIGGALLCFGICIVLFFRRRISVGIFRCALFAVSCAVGILLYSGWDIFCCRPVQKNAGAEFYGECTVLSADRYSSGGARYIVECVLPSGDKGKAAYYSYTENDLVRGDKITLHGTLALPESGGFFDAQSYLNTMDVFLIFDDAEITDIDIKENNIFEYIRRFRAKTTDTIRKSAGGDQAEAVIGMLFGNSFWDMPEHTERLMYRAGIGHTASVSGMHMSIVAGIAASVMSAFGSSKRSRFFAVCIFTLFFALTADLTVSVVRSVIMIIIVYAAELFNRKSDPLTSLAAAVILITAASPFCVRSPSFMLSVSGVLGTAVLSPAAVSALERRINQRRREDDRFRAGALLSAAITSVTASVAVFPAAAASFDEISVISPLSNLILSPLCTAAVILAAAGAVVSLVPFLSYAVRGLFFAAGMICKAVLSAAGYLGSRPMAAIPAGLDISAPLLMTMIISTAVCFAATGSKSHTMLIFSASVFMSVIAAAAYWTAPAGCERLTVLSEGKGCVIVKSDGDNAVIFDLMGTKRGAEAAQSYITRTGAGEVMAAVLVKNAQTAADIYSEKYPSASIISANAESGLTYSEEDTIISIGDCKFIPRSGYDLIELDGAEIICINSRSDIPGQKFDLVVYNCIADVSAEGSAYAVTRRNFRGAVPAGVPCAQFRVSDYLVSGGSVYPEEETKWLR